MAIAAIDELITIMATLRDPARGCPWDLDQNFTTIAPYTIEEAYEVADAIDRRAWDDLKDELGDLFFQVVFHSRLAEELGHFDLSDVAQGICEKMIRRHPHVFADAQMADASEQTDAWEALKAAERANVAEHAGASLSALDGVPGNLPALMRAVKLQRRAGRVGFDWPGMAPVIDKVREELCEFESEALAADVEPERLEEELGDLLFTIVNLARHANVDPDGALRRANQKFERRFRSMEASADLVGRPLEELDAAALESLWAKVKARE